MKTSLLQYLICPSCQVSLDLHVLEQKQNEILEGILKCSMCKKEFSIHAGIPSFLDSASLKRKKKTADRFGYEWTHFPKILKEYEAQFLSWLSPLAQDFFKDKIVLDAGCGMGRHAYFSSHFGAKEVIGFDISDSVHAAYENTKHLPNTHIVQADIYNLPFKSCFDFVYSIGVIHHLPDPSLAVKNLSRFIKSPSGTLLFWVYGYEGNSIIIYFFNPLRLVFTRWLPLPILKLLSFLLTLPLHFTAKWFYKPLWKIPVLKKVGNYLPLFHYIVHISDFSFTQNYSIVFDHLLAPIANYYKREELEKWVKEIRLENTAFMWRNQNSWTVIGTIQKIDKP